MDPNYRHICNFDLTEAQIFPSKKYNMRQFGRIIDPIARKMLSDLSVGTCRPKGSLAIVDLA